VHVLIDAELYLKTASPKEQKYRTPVWFGASGEAMKV